jgi:hypothetical protein
MSLPFLKTAPARTSATRWGALTARHRVCADGGWVSGSDRAPVDPALYQGAIPSRLVAPLAHLRTDLDRFAPEEADLLSYHAYWSTHARLGALHPELVVARPSWRDYEALTTDEVKRLERVLTLGVRRLRVRLQA